MSQATFSSLTAEAKYHILNYLSENKDIPHSCCEITQAVQQQNEAIRETIISGALHALWSSGRIIKPFRGAYQINNTPSTATSDYPKVRLLRPSYLSRKKPSHTSILFRLESQTLTIQKLFYTTGRS